jgi:prepilin-type N-terminal cleavage/methylation domain-containing protein
VLRRFQRLWCDERAFALIEPMAVVAILGILTARIE